MTLALGLWEPQLLLQCDQGDPIRAQGTRNILTPKAIP